MKDPVSIFGCWRGFQFPGAWQQPRTSAREVHVPISALLARIRELIPKQDDRHYDEIARGFGVGELRTPPPR